jgi:long-chain acyl-CoA synthetase
MPEPLETVVLMADEWTPENGLATAAQKIQRSKIAKAFDQEIKAAHSK